MTSKYRSVGLSVHLTKKMNKKCRRGCPILWTPRFLFNSKTDLHISLFRYRKQCLGGYLAYVMWNRRVTILKADPFDQILRDISKFYDPNEWRSCGETDIFNLCSTERKQRHMLRKGVNLVSLGFKALIQPNKNARLCINEFPVCLFVFQSSKQSGDSVQIDKQGRVVLGGNKFLILSKRLKRNKVRRVKV